MCARSPVAVLVKEVDCICHVAAQVTWVLPYRLLRTPNVLGTLEVIRLACTGKRKALFFVSTSGVNHGTAEEGFNDDMNAQSGYTLSKIVAEKYIRAAAGAPPRLVSFVCVCVRVCVYACMSIYTLAPSSEQSVVLALPLVRPVLRLVRRYSRQ